MPKAGSRSSKATNQSKSSLPPTFASINRTILRLHTHQALEAKCIKRGSPYRFVVSIGGVRSGKSLVISRWMLDRGEWDTAQMHGIFANTKAQLDSILQDVMPWVEAAGIEWQAHRRPPREWIESWRRRGIVTPPRRQSYRGILILSSGLHVQLGSLENRAFTKFRGAKWGSAIIEEVTAGASERAVNYIFDRVSCGIRKRCKAEHHHVRVIHANPPDDDGHWIYEWLARQERLAAKKAGVAPSDDNDSYPCLVRGVGEIILIPSRTRDNEENLPEEYIGDISSVLDEETAKRVLDGVLTRRKTGRAYNGFDRKSEWRVAYDPDRTLYLFFDFNNNPTVAGFAHPLVKGEYPSEHHRDGLSHVGVFGEFFHIGGMDAHQLALALARGEIGSNGSMPSSWKGLSAHRGPVVAFGDATAGTKKSMTGTTPWTIVNEVLREACRDSSGHTRYSVDLPDSNPLQQVRVRSVNGKFANHENVRSLWIDPRCHELIIDLNTVTTQPDGTILKPGGPRAGTKFWHRTHLSDALGYMIHRLFPMGYEIDSAARLKVIKRGHTPIPSFI